MSKPRSLSREQARRIALYAQGFGAKNRSTPVNRGHLRRLVRRMHIVQLDSVPVIIRTQYMPAFSRLGPYDPSLLDDIAYRHDDWFEAFVHEDWDRLWPKRIPPAASASSVGLVFLPYP